MKLSLLLSMLAAVSTTALAANKTIMDLTLNTNPSSPSVIEVQDPNATPQSGRFLLTNLVRRSSVSLGTNTITASGDTPPLPLWNSDSWPSGGGGDSVWSSDTNGVIAAQNGQVKFSASGFMSLGQSNSPAADWDLLSIRDALKGANMSGAGFFLLITPDGNSTYGSIGAAIKTNSATLSLQVSTADNNYFTQIQHDPSGVGPYQFQMGDDDGVYVNLSPGATAPNAPYFYDTPNDHPSGQLVIVKNWGDKRFQINWDGSITTLGLEGITNSWIFKEFSGGKIHISVDGTNYAVAATAE